MLRAFAAIVCAGLVACGGSKKPTAPDAAAICAGTTSARDAIVLHSGDPIAGGKARGLRELASRAPAGNAGAVAELDRFVFASDTAAIFLAHAEERERKVREDLESARAIVQTIREAEERERGHDDVVQPPERLPVDWPFAEELRFPVAIGARGAAVDVAAKAAELTKPLVDGSALQAVTERAKALANALDDLARKLAALDSAPEGSAGGVPIAEAIKIANVAHGKLNETIAALNTNGSSLAALADEQNGRRFAEAVRLWSRLAASAARLADPWPTGVPPARTRAFVIAGPRQWVVTCSTPGSFAPPPALLAALAPITRARDGLARSLGITGVASDPPSLAALAAALDAASKR